MDALARNEIIEQCAAILDRAAQHYDEYAAKYADADGDRADIQSRTCRQQASAIRRLKE